MSIQEKCFMKKKWTIRRYNNYAEFQAGIVPETIVDATGQVLPGESTFEGNVLLNEGINNVLLPLLCGTSAPNAYDNTNAYLGVGESATAAAASQTGLQGASLTYKGMAATYPQVGSQTATWQAEFGSSDANNAWQEFTVVNSNSDTGDNFNRKVSDQGTKASGQTWTLTLEITFS